jgi:kumamolisin
MQSINFNKYTPLPTTARQPEVGDLIGPVSRDTLIKFTIELPPTTQREALDEIVRRAILDQNKDIRLKEMTREQLRQLWNASPTSLAQVFELADHFNLRATNASLIFRTVDLVGRATDVERAFRVKLHSYLEPRGGVSIQRNGALEVPDQLSELRVFGLDERRMANSHARRASASGSAKSAVGYFPDQIGRAYGVPLVNSRKLAQRAICLIELGGRASRRYYESYCKARGYALGQLVLVRSDGAERVPPYEPKGADGEVMLDICVAAGVAQGITLIVIFAENTERGLISALKLALNHELDPSMISISWGAPETEWTLQAMASIGDVVQECVLRKIKVFAAAGDNEASDNVKDGRFTVDFPSALDLVWSCGGTHIDIENGAITKERVWGAATKHCQGKGVGTGGGISQIVPRPAWQHPLNPPLPEGALLLPGRLSPDWAFAADPLSGWIMKNTDGKFYIIGGTSAVAPFCAAALSCIEASCGYRLPASPAWLYQLWRAEPSLFRDITQGSNGYPAASGYDLCTGLGSLQDFGALLELCAGWRKAA